MHDAERTANLLRTLGHPARLQTLDAVASGFADVLSISEWIGESSLAVEAHLDVLLAQELVRRDGPRMVRRSSELDRYAMTETGELALQQVRRLTEALDASHSS